jgi:hypothetical protein
MAGEFRFALPMFRGQHIAMTTNEINSLTVVLASVPCRILLQPFSCCFNDLQRHAEIPCDMDATRTWSNGSMKKNRMSGLGK